MNDGYLNESPAHEPGRRILDGKPGVYMFPKERKGKRLVYARNICLADDGVFLRCMWEVMTDRSDSFTSGNDQWIARERGTRISALWVNVRSINQLQHSEEVQMVWDEALEIPPKFVVTPDPSKKTGKGPEPKAKPPGAKQEKAVKPSSSDTHEVSTSGAGVILVPGSEVGRVSLPAEEETDWWQVGSPDDVYRTLLLDLKNDRMVEEVAQSNIHSPFSWALAWILKDVEANGELMKRLKMVIWQQTLLAIGNRMQ